MSHFDNLVTTIADALLAEETDDNVYEAIVGNTVDVSDPTGAWIDGVFDLAALAKAIVAAGWVHADELDRLRAEVVAEATRADELADRIEELSDDLDRVRKLRDQWFWDGEDEHAIQLRAALEGRA